MCGASIGVDTYDERRVVTVLFADVVGYTSLAEHLDPERTKRLIEACFQMLAADIEAFGGRVDKVIGDAIVGLFGAPIAHEDDAERAIRAALQMHDTMATFAGAAVRADGDSPAGSTPLELRIGINTGEVLVGGLVGSDYTAMGDVVNLAARLQTAAPVGRVLIGDATNRLCPPSITTEPFATDRLKGRTQTEQSWVVAGALAAGTRPVRADVPFVGRGPERQLLDAAVGLVESGHSAIVSVVGEAGSGKTRLVDELLGDLGPDVVVSTAIGTPYGETTPWAPLRAASTTLLEIEPNLEFDALRRAVVARATTRWGLDGESPEVERYADVVSHLCGQPSALDRLDPTGAQDEVVAVFVDMVRRTARDRLTVLWVDNFQWVDPLVLDLLVVALRSAAELPLLVITAHRGGDGREWPPPVERPVVVRLALAPLGHAESLALVESILGTPVDDDSAGGSARISERVVDRGGGNPLYLVELAELARSGPTSGELPGSLQALIAARLDQLPAGQRAIVENAALLGISGPLKALSEFAGELGQPFGDADVDELAESGWLDVDGGWWRFRSDVVREVAYRTLTKQNRARRHVGVAEFLVGAGRTFLDEIASHQARAAELVADVGPVDGVPGDIADIAAATLERAAREAMAAGRFVHVVRQASRALSLGVGDGSLAARLQLLRGTALNEQRKFSEAKRDLVPVLAKATDEGWTITEGEARVQLGIVHYSGGELDRGRRLLDEAIAIFVGLDDQHRRAAAVRARGFAEVFGGSLVEARRYLDDAMNLYHVIDDERGKAWTQQNLAWVAFQAGDPATALRELAEARERFATLGDRAGTKWAEGLQAYVLYFQRRFDEAEALAAAVSEESARWGDSWALLMMQALLANLRLWTGHPADTVDLCERALVGFRTSGDLFGTMVTLSPLIRARVALGETDELAASLEELISLGQRFSELGMALQGAAGASMHAGDGAAAVRLAEDVLARNALTGAVSDEANILLLIGRLQSGDHHGALSVVDEFDLTGSPFGRAATALAHAMTGDAALAIQLASDLDGDTEASYFDQALSQLAGVVAAVRIDDDDATRRWLARLSAHAAIVGDVVFEQIASRMVGRIGGSGATDGRARTELGAGWRHVVDTVPVVTSS